RHPRDLPSFPTRRSSDLASETFTYTYTITQVDIDNGSIYNEATVSGEDPNNSPVEDTDDETVTAIQTPGIQLEKTADVLTYDSVDRKSTRLNSSHVKISY